MKELTRNNKIIVFGGGVTFSGGECMLQLEFLLEILKKCKENGIHTAVDTAGHIPLESFEKILPFTDLFLYDIKTMNDEIHKEHTGVSNSLILENMTKLLDLSINVWVRIPVIPGVNDIKEEMKNIKAFFDANGYPKKIELLPYHAMGEYKYTALGKSAKKFDVPDKEKIRKIKKNCCPILISPVSGAPVIQNGKLVGTALSILLLKSE